MTVLAVACVVYLVIALPLAMFFCRMCGLYRRCTYVDDTTREYREDMDG